MDRSLVLIFVDFFSGQGLLEGKTASEISTKLSNTWGSTLIDNWKLWPVVQFVNFKFVPLEQYEASR